MSYPKRLYFCLLSSFVLSQSLFWSPTVIVVIWTWVMGTRHSARWRHEGLRRVPNQATKNPASNSRSTHKTYAQTQHSPLFGGEGSGLNPRRGTYPKMKTCKNSKYVKARKQKTCRNPTIKQKPKPNSPLEPDQDPKDEETWRRQEMRKAGFNLERR